MKKVVLVTGCSSGFGRALCESFVNRNYYVIASARDLSKLEAVTADMKIEMDVRKLALWRVQTHQWM